MLSRRSIGAGLPLRECSDGTPRPRVVSIGGGRNGVIGMTKASNVILVQGAWADGSSWSKVIPILIDRGLRVTAVQLPLTSLKETVEIASSHVAMLARPEETANLILEAAGRGSLSNLALKSA
jgi:hypothetical protein